MFFLKIFSTESDRYSRVKHEWQITMFWSARALHWASVERELARFKGWDTGSDGPGELPASALHGWCQNFCPILQSLSSCLPEQAPWRYPLKTGLPRFPSLNSDEDCLSHGKPTHCLFLPWLQLKRPNLGHGGEDGVTAGHRPRCPAVSRQPPPASEAFWD